MTNNRYRKITLKIGSNVLTKQDGLPNEERIADLVSQIAILQKSGTEVLLVSSGAVASGKKFISSPKKHDTISSRQLWAAVGQVRLIQLYNEFFSQHGLICAQILATKESFRDRIHFLNMRNCIEAVLAEGNVVPVINENDVVSVNELMFTDNDELAGLIANMMDTDALIILSNIDGVYTGDPASNESKLITEINPDVTLHSVSKYISTSKSSMGRGGMATKFSMAHKVAMTGTPVHLANGTRANILLDIINNIPETPQTYFVPAKKCSSVKKWLAHSDADIKGEVHVNANAVVSLFSNKATSLLPIGVTHINGSFMKGDIVGIFDPDHILIGMGKAEYNSDTAIKKIGVRNSHPIIHYDYLYLKSD